MVLLLLLLLVLQFSIRPGCFVLVDWTTGVDTMTKWCCCCRCCWYWVAAAQLLLVVVCRSYRGCCAHSC
jgi:hypothetical protein